MWMDVCVLFVQEKYVEGVVFAWRSGVTAQDADTRGKKSREGLYANIGMLLHPTGDTTVCKIALRSTR